MNFTDKHLNTKSKNSDILNRNTNVSNNFDFYLDEKGVQLMSPEDYLLAKEDANLAGEIFEGSPYQSNILGYQTPHSAEEVIEKFARKRILGKEFHIFNQITLNGDIKKAERRFKRWVSKRIEKIEELKPRMLNLYKIHR